MRNKLGAKGHATKAKLGSLNADEQVRTGSGPRMDWGHEIYRLRSKRDPAAGVQQPAHELALSDFECQDVLESARSVRNWDGFADRVKASIG